MTHTAPLPMGENVINIMIYFYAPSDELTALYSQVLTVVHSLTRWVGLVLTTKYVMDTIASIRRERAFHMTQTHFCAFRCLRIPE